VRGYIIITGYFAIVLTLFYWTIVLALKLFGIQSRLIPSLGVFFFIAFVLVKFRAAVAKRGQNPNG
jgi:hypothetical protein